MSKLMKRVVPEEPIFEMVAEISPSFTLGFCGSCSKAVMVKSGAATADVGCHRRLAKKQTTTAWAKLGLMATPFRIVFNHLGDPIPKGHPVLGFNIIIADNRCRMQGA